MLAIIRALEDWRHYLEGLPEPFEIITDHQNLEYWCTSQNLTRRQAQWSIWLSRFNFFLMHKPGKTNTRADPLSRIPSLQVMDEEDNQGQIVLKPEWFAKISADQTEVVTPLEDRLHQASMREAKVLQGLKALKEHGPRNLTNGLLEWEEEAGIVYQKGKIYITAEKWLRNEVLRQCHEGQKEGKTGKKGNLELVKS